MPAGQGLGGVLWHLPASVVKSYKTIVILVVGIIAGFMLNGRLNGRLNERLQESVPEESVPEESVPCKNCEEICPNLKRWAWEYTPCHSCEVHQFVQNREIYQFCSNEGWKNPHRTSAAKGSKYLLLIFVLSSLEGRERRDAIRNTWAKESNTVAVVKFGLGTHNITTSHEKTIMDEQETNHDLVLLKDSTDNYEDLTFRVLSSFAWADANVQFSYLLKTDDDSFVRVDKFVEELSARSPDVSLYWGYFTGDRLPMTEGQWAEPDWFVCNHYVPYAYGGGYVLSYDLVRKLAMDAKALQSYKCEDASMGLWLSPYIMERKHDPRFDTKSISRGCNNLYIIQHKVSVKEMYKKHQSLLTTGNLCEKELGSWARGTYVYNWKTNPTKCCHPIFESGIP